MSGSETVAFIIGLSIFALKYVALIIFLVRDLGRQIEAYEQRKADAERSALKRRKEAQVQELEPLRSALSLTTEMNELLAKLRKLHRQQQHAQEEHDSDRVLGLLSEMELVYTRYMHTLDIFEFGDANHEANADNDLKKLLTKWYVLGSCLMAAQRRDDRAVVVVFRAEIMILEAEIEKRINPEL